MYGGSDPYISLLEAWINESYQSNASFWNRFQVLWVLKKVQFPTLIQMKIMVQTQNIINEVLSWITLKEKGKLPCMNFLLRWLHLWYDLM